MNKSESRTAWIVAGILAVLLLITLSLWLAAKKDLLTVLEKGNQDIATIRERIAADCEGPNKKEVNCRADESELSILLAQVSRDLHNATSTTSSTSSNP